ncbi:uncharacterized protein LOC110861527 isoform X2 [Folsomia candida]|uniref:uncharacterized protein LOC110861527 isoform X2 n=1 Tax=Folsomia candida TaxID=158441 RepID=UPI000B900816|nr:uncharacterized protein LOC110861527 isoform X2 [Folsomia candida]
MKSHSVIILLISIYLSIHSATSVFVEHDEDIIKRSIIYDKKTPDVFYCPQEKPDGMNNMLVKSKPLSKLCEYQGQELPDRYLSDCYGNVDETVWACKEKKRIMKRREKLET